MFNRIATMIWGEFENKQEFKKFWFLAVIFFCIIGTYWALRPLKDSVFVTMVGVDFLPWAKLFSILIVAPLVVLYTKLIDTFPRQKVFYILISLYGFIAIFFTYLLLHPVYGLGNDVESAWRLTGWFWYVYVESFGSLIVALFWVITTDICLPDAARRGFPIIAVLGQFGNIVGPLALNAHNFGFANSAPIAAMCGFIMFVTAGLLWLFMKTTPADQLKGYEGKNEVHNKKRNKDVGFLDGLRLIASKGYLLGIFFMVVAYEAIVVVFDYHFKSMGKMTYTSEASYAAFLAKYAVATGVVSTLCVLFGINKIQKKLGMKTSLVLMPILVGIAALMLKFNPILSVAFWIMVFSKGVNYSLNAPTIKQLYIPTTQEARYKSQGWIEMFGSRAAKSGGSLLNLTRGMFKANYGPVAGISIFLTISTVASLGIIGIWVLVALFVAQSYTKATQEKTYVC